MKILKSELVEKINMVKGIIASRTTLPALQCLLVQDGYLIASGGEMLLQVILQGAEGESLLLTPAAYELIPAIDADEIEITQDSKFYLTIKGGKTKSKFASYNPEPYPFEMRDDKGEETTVNVSGEDFTEALKQVLWAVENRKDEHRTLMKSVGIEARDGQLNFCGMSTAQLAWCRYDFEGEMSLVLPEPAAKKLTGLAPEGNMVISYTSKLVKFVTGDMILMARLADGQYLNYQQIFANPLSSETVVNRNELISVLNRMNLVRQGEKLPAVLTLNGSNMTVEYRGATSQLSEEIAMDVAAKEEVIIGMNPQLLLRAFKVLTEDKVTICYDSGKMPICMTGGRFNLRVMTLPVNIAASAAKQAS